MSPLPTIRFRSKFRFTTRLATVLISWARNHARMDRSSTRFPVKNRYAPQTFAFTPFCPVCFHFRREASSRASQMRKSGCGNPFSADTASSVSCSTSAPLPSSPQGRDEGALLSGAVRAHRLAKLLGGARHVQHVVPDLEGPAQLLSIAGHGPPLLRAPPRQYTPAPPRRRSGRRSSGSGAAPAHSGTGSAPPPPYPAPVPPPCRRDRPPGRGSPLPLPSAPGEQIPPGSQHLKGRGEQAVPGQNSRGLAIHHVVGGAAPAQVVVVHGGQVVVNEGSRYAPSPPRRQRAGPAPGRRRTGGSTPGSARAGPASPPSGCTPWPPGGPRTGRPPGIWPPGPPRSASGRRPAGAQIPGSYHSSPPKGSSRGCPSSCGEQGHLLLRLVQLLGTLPQQLGPLLEQGHGLFQGGVPPAPAGPRSPPAGPWTAQNPAFSRHHRHFLSSTRHARLPSDRRSSSRSPGAASLTEAINVPFSFRAME